MDCNKYIAKYIIHILCGMVISSAKKYVRSRGESGRECCLGSHDWRRFWWSDIAVKAWIKWGSSGDTWRKSVQTRGNSRCKGPEASEAGSAWSVWRSAWRPVCLEKRQGRRPGNKIREEGRARLVAWGPQCGCRFTLQKMGAIAGTWTEQWYNSAWVLKRSFWLGAEKGCRGVGV